MTPTQSKQKISKHVHFDATLIAFFGEDPHRTALYPIILSRENRPRTSIHLALYTGMSSTSYVFVCKQTIRSMQSGQGDSYINLLIIVPNVGTREIPRARLARVCVRLGWTTGNQAAGGTAPCRKYQLTKSSLQKAI